MDALDRLVSYTQWANHTWLDFVREHCAEDEYLRMMISHIYLAEQVWFQRIYGEAVRPDVFSTLDLSELAHMADFHESRYAEQLAGDLLRVVRYAKFDGESMQSSIVDMLNHVVTHGSHHRGQMATHVSRSGLKPPETSFITFSRRRTQCPN